MTDVDITVTCLPFVSYAMAHNRLPAVQRLEITNRGPEIRGGTVRVVVADDAGTLSHPFDRIIDLPVGGTVVLDDVEVRLNGSAMHEVRTQAPGRVRVSVLDGDRERGAAETDVVVLAGNTWLMQPLVLCSELLAAHVMPNSPEVTDILKSASARLTQSTGSPALPGYQGEEPRVRQVVSAIYDAVADRDIRYANPPAGWGEAGQKVRTPAEVLGDSIGTCLDTTVLLAACLEQAGIHPLLWLFREHAYVGYWTQELTFPESVQTDLSVVVNHVDLGNIEVLETTSVTQRAEPIPFEAAGRSARTLLAGEPDEFQAVVDVRAARKSGILPLPARGRSDTGELIVIEYRPAEHSRPPLIIHGGRGAGAAPVAPAGPAVPPRVTQWKNALLDLSLRNKLINFTARNTVNLAVPSRSLGLVEDLLHADRAIKLLPSDRVDAILRARGMRFGRDLPEEARAELVEDRQEIYTDVTEGTYQSRLRSLAYRARTIVEETGANNLYLALGSLVWELDGRELRSPLILVPVTLISRGRQSAYRIELDETGQSTPNFCLLEKLKQSFGLAIPGLANPKADDSGIDLDAAFLAVRQAIAAKGMPFRVEGTADLAILQFAKFRLWKDLDENWADFGSNALVDHLTHRPTEPFPDVSDERKGPVDLDALATACPIPADASQLTAIADAVSGRTFVLEGPPGTGKSQTITNLLARAMADGRRVLFVAEKRAALEVVTTRLDAVGMGPFSLDLHDKGSKPVSVRTQIHRAIEHRVGVDREGLQARRDETTSAVRLLTRYAQRLHEENGAGLSLYSATTRLLTLRDDVPPLTVPPTLLAAAAGQQVESLRALFRMLPEVADPARPGRHHPWGFVGVDDLEAGSVAAVQRASVQIDTALSSLRTEPTLSGVLGAAVGVGELESLAEILRTRYFSLDTLDLTRTAQWRSDSAATREEIHAFVAAAHPGLGQATPDALALPLADIHAQAQNAAASGWFGRKKRLRAVLELLEPGLRPGHTVQPKDVPPLTAVLVQLQGAANHLAARSADLPGVTLPHTWNPLTPEGERVVADQLQWLEWAGGVVDDHGSGAGFAGELRSLIASGATVASGSLAAIDSLVASLKQILSTTKSSPTQLEGWRDGVGLLHRWEQTAASRNSADPALVSLVRWLELRHCLTALDTNGMPEAKSSLLTGAVAADDATDAFERGLAEASIAERRLATGLDGFDRSNHEKSIARFGRSLHEVQGLLRQALPEQVVQNRSFSSETEIGRIGELRRELTKTRRGLGVRALMDQYGDIITQLAPCVLVSPDSLARFFPPRAGLFDLVVFDEASQIRVADAIGAMGRASSVVIVGDSKQMPPTSVAEATIDVDIEDAEVDLVVEDEESILTEGVQAGVPRHWLSWHYRSQDESLISFSNVHYYEGRLSSFPAPVVGAADPGVDGHGVNLVRVSGEFHRSGKGKLLRTNPKEADAIVSELQRRFDAAPPGQLPSVGVVTFNLQQRAYIEALIRDHEDQRMAEALDSRESEGLFVKNLENVQGDERDVILFSTAFSVNEKGVLPLNFGPLNRGGGERRLNVAITRARRQVILFSSFEPNQLRAEESTSKGLKHLRAYLDLAASGPGTLVSRELRTRTVDRHREDIAGALRDRGYEVKTDVGLSDFRVDLVVSSKEEDARPLAAVLLDGPDWARRRTVGDRDGLPSDVLRRMLRWPHVERVWLPAWLDDRVGVLDALEARLASGPGEIADPAHEPLNRPTTPRDSAPDPRSAVPWTGGGPLAHPALLSRVHPQRAASPTSAAEPKVAAPPLAGPAGGRSREDPPGKFRPWRSGLRGTRDHLDSLEWSGSAKALVRQAILDAVNAEGPIHEDRLARMVAAPFGLTRVNAKRIGSILAEVPRELRRGPERDFVWPVEMNPSVWSLHRRDKDGQRPIEHVSLVELANAMAWLSRKTGGIEREEAMRAALLEFGFARMTPGVVARLQLALNLGIHTGRVALAGSYVVRGDGLHRGGDLH